MNINLNDLKELDKEDEDLEGLGFELLSKRNIITQTQLNNLFPSYNLDSEEYKFIQDMLKSETPESLSELISHLVEFRDIINTKRP